MRAFVNQCVQHVNLFGIIVAMKNAPQNTQKLSLKAMAAAGAVMGLEPVMAPELGPDGFWLIEEGGIAGAAVVVLCLAGSPVVPLEAVHALRKEAAHGMRAQLILVSRRGVYAKDVGPLEVDGWMGMGEKGAAVFYETRQLQRLCDSDARWFA